MSDAALVDLATTFWACPATDLAYFFFLSTTPQFREENLDGLLEYYHTKLTDTLRKLGDNEEYTLE